MIISKRELKRLLNLREIENVQHDAFDYHGEHWTLANYPKNKGFVPDGLWNDMTNGKIVIRVHKSELLRIDPKKAVALFN